MADHQPTIGELFKAKAVTDEAIARAVAAIVSGEMSDTYPIAEGLVLDLAAAVKAHKGARSTEDVLADPSASVGFKCSMARAAVILARPVKA